MIDPKTKFAELMPVAGTYAGIPFTGRLVNMRPMPDNSGEIYTVKLDKPIDHGRGILDIWSNSDHTLNLA